MAMSSPDLTIPEAVTFEQAIALTQSLLDHLDQSTLSPGEVESPLTTLLSSENGARGFFVTYLTDDRPLADHPSDDMVKAMRSSPEIVAELLVKNLAMSSAMAITHRRNQHEEMAQGSERVRSRTRHLIQQLQLPQIQEKAQRLQESVRTGQGDYQAFLQRWGYDAEQRQAIEKTLEEAIGKTGG
jgi:hypothetical protein